MRVLPILLIAASARAAAPGYLGVVLDAGEGTAPRVVGVVPDSPAHRAGLEIGDEIHCVGARVVKAPSEIVAIIGRAAPGDSVRIWLRRRGEFVAAVARLDPRPSAPQDSTRGLLGKQAPPFFAEAGAGPQAASLESHRGKYLLLDFGATWCGPCRAIEPALAELHRRYGTRGLSVVSLSAEPFELLTDHRRRARLPYTVAHDPGGTIAARYLVFSIPSLFLIDPQGKILQVGAGDLLPTIDDILRRELVGR